MLRDLFKRTPPRTYRVTRNGVTMATFDDEGEAARAVSRFAMRPPGKPAVELWRGDELRCKIWCRVDQDAGTVALIEEFMAPDFY